MGASWTTYPTGGDFGNRIITIALSGGFIRAGHNPPVEFGGGFVIFGDYTGFGPAFILPTLRLLVGRHDDPARARAPVVVRVLVRAGDHEVRSARERSLDIGDPSLEPGRCGTSCGSSRP